MSYNIKADHEALKKQIKEWEIELDHVVNELMSVSDDPDYHEIVSRVYQVSDQMMAVNL